MPDKSNRKAGRPRKWANDAERQRAKRAASKGAAGNPAQDAGCNSAHEAQPEPAQPATTSNGLSAIRPDPTVKPTARPEPANATVKPPARLPRPAVPSQAPVVSPAEFDRFCALLLEGRTNADALQECGLAWWQVSCYARTDHDAARRLHDSIQTMRQIRAARVTARAEAVILGEQPFRRVTQTGPDGQQSVTEIHEANPALARLVLEGDEPERRSGGRLAEAAAAGAGALAAILDNLRGGQTDLLPARDIELGPPSTHAPDAPEGDERAKGQ